MDSFSFNHIGMSNLRIPGFDPVSFSVFGMAVVFFGLIFISLYIYFLPIFLDFASQCKKKILSQKVKEKDNEVKNSTAGENEILMAIAAAFHLDQDFPEDNQKITWLSHGLDESSWLAAGIAHGVSRRHNLHITRRKF